MGDGGPNWVENNVDAPILVSPSGDGLWVSPMYFHLAHYSKYVLPGSKVMTVDHSGSALSEIAAFMRPDNRIVVVILCDTIDGQGDPPANNYIHVVVGGYDLQIEMFSSSIVTAIFDAPKETVDALGDQATEWEIV